MNTIFRTIALAALILPLSVCAAGAGELTDATVRKVDKAAARVTLAHGPINNLGMPPMTMTFKARDAALLKKVKEGDKVRFRAEEIDGAYTVVRIEPAK